MDPNEPITVQIETPLGGFVKRRADGTLDYVSPLPCPFNYGCVPTHTSGDGDPLDAVLLGARMPTGSKVDARPWAWIAFVDAGQQDPKLVCSSKEPTRAERALIVGFFWAYARLKGLLNRLRGAQGETAYRGWQPLSTLESAVELGTPDSPTEA